MKTKINFPGKKFLITMVVILIAIVNMSYFSASKAKKQTKTDRPAQVAIEKVRGEYDAEILPPPLVPQAINEEGPHKVNVGIEVIEKPITLDDGVKYNAWTFNGTVPGPFVRVREGDLVHVNFKNDPSSVIAHNIDMHAVTGPGGGAEATMTAPGYETSFEFRALNPGLYIYHCAAPPVGMHIANGMYGLIYVEPQEGLDEVDKEFYLVQSEFYTNKEKDEEGYKDFDMKSALDENPEYVVFDGSVGALTGNKALEAKVGDKIRLYVGNAGPNLTSSFHVIGVILDDVYHEGGSVVNHNVQTTSIPAGGATVVEFTAKVPGSYTIVDHAIFRAFNKGAIAEIKVTGDDNKAVFTGQLKNEEIDPAL